MNEQQITKNHKLRRFFSGLTGFIAITAAGLFIPAYWLNQSFGTNERFTNTVSTTLQTPSVKTFIADELSMQLAKEAPAKDLQKALSTTDPARVQQLLQERLLNELQKPEADQLVKDASKKLYAGLFENSGTQIIDLQPELQGFLRLVAGSDLTALTTSPLSKDSGVITLKNQELQQLKQARSSLSGAWLWLLVIALISATTSIALAQHRWRRTAVLALLLAIISTTYWLTISSASTANFDSNDKLLHQALQDTTTKIFADMRQLSAFIAISSLVVAVATWLMHRHNNDSTRKQIEKI